MSRFHTLFLTMMAGLTAVTTGIRYRARALTTSSPVLGTSVAVLSLLGMLRMRAAELHKDERGDGGGTALTTVLLAVGGVLAVGAVVAGVGVAIAAALGKLG